ncbi:MAG: adenylyltransferase [Alphaproteobacteria bacterium]|nr:adenylyltransferase [Alphaproteobacteria bacterium]HCP01528.1 adenylyltransferase [Rhodospirillaceae bacterium]
MKLSDEQFYRYARHLILDEVGEEGQETLLKSQVLVVGAGGLGAPLLMYLAAAGVGTLGIIDSDEVDLTNLQRQIIHTTDAVGRKKTESARETIFALNPDINVVTHNTRLDVKNAADIVAGYDLVADGSDNFETRYLLNDLCYKTATPLVAAAMLRFEGQLFTFRRNNNMPTACYRCIFPNPPPEGLVPRCEEAGILGALAGVMGSLQTTEVLKELLGLGESLAGRMLIYDALNTGFHTINVPRNLACTLCGES